MNTMSRLLLTACLALPLLAACKKEEAAPVAVAAPLTAPAAGSDDAAWRAYVSDVVTRNMEGIGNQPFVYFLPSTAGAEDQTGAYERLLDKAKGDVARGIVKGNLLAYASADSARMGDIVVESFAGVPADTMKGVRVLFIGAAADKDRVATAVAPAGVEYVFIEAK
ncbi:MULTISPECIES: hypothetical protein [unclassified Luteimonas]|uniref:hypothetical protein n=1 Tax=unclassified Luteimonas TaxID=2629088 RepID=UPI001600BB89|nr:MULTISPECIES: hypothetical protein [unclassified Luteimonas]MBB1472176.1 hypothetical protein [Luteimonas sp. MC1782]MBB6599097.1 hypothetical protein [Luteimonas sp. MC1825]QOC89223.1 hypothetical protein IDM46_05785 [Luteimonas sp. MC1825]